MADDADLDEIIQRTLRELVEDGTIDPDDPDAAKVANAVTGALQETGRAMAADLREHRTKTLAEHREIRHGFELRLQELWGPALDALEAVIIVAFEAGDLVSKAEGSKAIADDPQLAAIIRLHARACLVGSEILALLRSGHAAGALARWRTLHELAVVALFIRDRDRQTAERYLVHADVRVVGRLDAYQKFAEKLGDVRLTPEEEQAIRARRAEILAGVSDPKDFATDWGWAGPIDGNTRPKFEHLMAAVDLEHWRPIVDLAHYPVHASSAGLTNVLGTDGNHLLAGASNAGLADVGHQTAIALQLATLGLLHHRLKAERSVQLIALSELVADVGQAFAAGQEEYECQKTRQTLAEPAP
jgi:hypothetical protein